MTPSTPMQTDTDNTKNILRLGFSAMILLLMIVVAFSMYRVDALTYKLSAIVENNFRKIELVSQMRRAVEERWVALHKIIATQDVFERDKWLQQFYAGSRQYRLARDAFFILPHSEAEQTLHAKLDEKIRTAQPLVRHFVESMVDEPPPFPSEHAVEQVKQYQKTVLDILQEMITEVHREANEAVSDAKSDLTQTYTVMLLLLGSIVFLSLLIARRVTESVNNKNRALANATKVKSRFLANMSHEIRTPLTAVLGFAEELLKPELSHDERLAAASIILRNGEHLQHIVNEILDLSKDEANKLAAHKSNVHLMGLISDIEATLRHQAVNKAIHFDINYQPPLPKFIFTDPVKLKQILFNLCNNAIKFTEKGGITINISCNVQAEQIHFDVIDSGIGVSAEQIRTIFEPFAQADTSASRRFGGTGLGLFLSRRFAELIGGTLSVDSDFGRGSCFTLSIPTGVIRESNLIVDFIQPAPSLPSTEHAVDIVSLSGNILLAEDTLDNQLLIRAYLKNYNLNITTVENGQQVIDMAKHHTNFDLILMDIQMPLMNGLQATKKLRAIGVKCPIIALTANVLTEDCNNYLASGFNDVIPKPVNRVQLIEKIAHYLKVDEVEELDSNEIYSTLLSEGDDFLPAIEHFVDQVEYECTQLSMHVTNGNWPELQKQLHRLKGSGGGVGFALVTDIAKQAETELKNENYAAVVTLVDKLGKVLRQLRINKPASTLI